MQKDKEQQIARLCQITQAVTDQDIVKIDIIAQELSQEIAKVQDSITNQYSWQILDDILEGNKIVFDCFEKLGSENENARKAVKILQSRIDDAISATKKAVSELKAAPSTPAEAVDNLREQLAQIQREVEEKDQTLLEQEK